MGRDDDVNEGGGNSRIRCLRCGNRGKGAIFKCRVVGRYRYIRNIDGAT